MENRLKSFLTGNPHYLGFIFALFGIAGLILAIIDANWLFGDVNKMTYNLKKIDGWVNFFGRKTARIISGVISVVIILSGLFWFIAGSKSS
ncbi:MAG: immunity 17 family protein [Treponema sp.]|jgi:hypothetical protein|nr:immunity 17 family protein [Treponema sp.]